MIKEIKCKGYCGKQYDRKLLVKVGSKDMCPDCAKKYEEEKKRKVQNRLYKCQGFCGESYKMADMIVNAGKKYCKSCYDKIIKDRSDMYILGQTICRLFDLPYVTPRIKKQINDYREKYDYTILGINTTLLYIEKNRNITFDEKYGIGIVGYYYLNAIKDYKEQANRMFENKNVEIKTNKNIIETLKPTTINEMKKQKLISLEECL